MKHYEHRMNQCMEIRVDSGGPVERPRKTWLENMEADMEELEIDIEDIHYMKKWRQNVMKRKFITIGL